MISPGAADVRWVGLDGARGGWAAAVLSDEGAAALCLVPTVSAVLARWPATECIFVDMPLGLPDGPSPRRCDTLARGLLPGRRGSSVFTPPCREALEAPDHATASRINRRVTGRGLSIQAWHLGPGIRELDDLLRGRPDLRTRVLEAHPEVLFTLLARTEANASTGEGLLPKRTAEGARQRRTVLETHLPGAVSLLDAVGVQRRKAAPDDWVDALVLALVCRMERGSPARLPDPPESDAHGIPMALALPTRE